MNIEIAGDDALMIYFAAAAGPAPTAQIQAARGILLRELPGVIRELVPGFASLLVIYDPWRVRPRVLCRRIAGLLASLSDGEVAAGGTLELPVYYSGPDLALVAGHSGLDIDTVIACHSGVDYQVQAIGFAPGFAYLGDLDERLALPRRSNPRLRVPKGAVAIANRHTAVYPQASPGGWHLIGLCPIPLFDPGRQPPMPFAVGDRVRFRAIDRGAYLALGGQP
ncbi:MAG: 5-oxoprolinase subunit PxpB [Porticoccaceae bacterium]|jgi:KipI family sensor histidine kinase inhibitor